MMSNEPSRQSYKCFRPLGLLTQLISRKKKSLNSRRNSIRSEAGNWRDKENGRGGDLREEAASSMLGVNLFNDMRESDMGVGVCGRTW